MIGKWHISTRPSGFTHWAIKRGGFYNPSFELSTGEKVKTTGHTTDVITERSLEWIGGRKDPKKPFCIWISHSASHRTWAPATRHLDLYADVDIPEPPTLFDDYAGRAAGATAAQMRVSRDLFPAYDLKLPITGKGILDGAAKGQLAAMTPEQRRAWHAAFGPRNEAYAKLNLKGDARTRWNYQRYIKNYLRSVAGLDESVGTVRKYLETHGLAKNTIVIYTADQGFYLGDHGWYDKRFIYEEALRTPFIVHWPGVTKPGSTSDAMVQNIDVAPTIYEFAGLDPPATMHGDSLVPLLKGETPGTWRNAIYYHYSMKEPDDRTSHIVAKHYGVRTARHKLIYFYELGE